MVTYAAGMRVEVILTEEGLAGSRYAGRIIEIAKAKALVEFEAFTEEEDTEALLREWHLIKNIQPIPPPMPDGFLRRLTQHDLVEVFYDDGWWVTQFAGTRVGANGTEYNVRSDLYQLERWVTADNIRPHWERWGTKWRQREQMRKPTQPKAAAPSSKATPATAKAPAAAAASNKSSSLSKPGSAIKAAPVVLELPPAKVSAISSAPPAADAALPAPRALPSMSASSETLCAKLLGEMRARDDAVWFAQPVDLAEVPDYLAVVANPMDYATVSRKLHAGEYHASPLAFAADMRRIFSNALTYNWDPEQECHQASMRALREFERLFADVLATHVAHEEVDGEGAAHGIDNEEGEREEHEEDVVMDDEDDQDDQEGEDNDQEDDQEGDRVIVVSPDHGDEEGEAGSGGAGSEDGGGDASEEAEEGKAERGAATRGVRGPLGAAADEAEMATLLEFVMACGGDEDALDGWALERQATRGDKIYVAPGGDTRLFSRLQVVRFLNLDEAAGMKKLKADREAKAAERLAQDKAKREAQRIEREAGREAREAQRAAERAKREEEKAADRLKKQEDRAKRDAEKEAERTRKREEREVRRAEAEGRRIKRQRGDGDAFGFHAPVRPDSALLPPPVWDHELPHLPTREGDAALQTPPSPLSPAKHAAAPAGLMRSLAPCEVTSMLMVSDFVRALGPRLGLPPECSTVGRLAAFVGYASDAGDAAGDAAEQLTAESSAEADVKSDALTQLHVQLLQVLLADETAGEWWPAGVASDPPDVKPHALARSAAPCRLPPDALTERNWPLVGAAVAVRLHDWLQSDAVPLLDARPPAATTAATAAASPLQRAVWAIWAEPLSKQPAAHSELAPAEQMALLTILVEGASQTSAAARAAEAQHAEWLAGLAALAESAKLGKAKPEHQGLASGVRAELARQAAPASKKSKGGGRPSDAAAGLPESSLGERQRQVVRHVSERHGLQGPLAILSREELDSAELDLLLEIELQSTPIDGLGRRRLPKTLFQANAVKKALLRRRDELRAARADALRQLTDATNGEGGAPTTRQLCAALAAGRAAALEGDASCDGITPLGAVRGRWMLAHMHEAYIALAAQLCDDRSPAARAAALKRLPSLSAQTTSLGMDRWGRRHWALSSPLEEVGEPGSRLICVQPPEAGPAGVTAGTIAPGVHDECELARGRSEWCAFAGTDQCEALAGALDDRGWHERKLQASLWGLCDDWLREAHGAREPSRWQVAEETLPRFEPDSLPVPALDSLGGNGRYEQADSIAGALSEEATDARMYAGAHARGWRIFAKDDNGHFWYRIGTYRFTNKTEALLFERGPEAPALASDATRDATAADEASIRAAEELGIAGERRSSSRRASARSSQA